MIIDAHNHLGDVDALDWHQSPEELIKQMDENGVDMAVVCPQAYPMTTVLEVNQRDNDGIADAVRRYPDRLIGFGVATPYGGPDKGAGEVERAIKKLGLRGIKLHQRLHGYHLIERLVGPILSACERLKVPVLVHSGDCKSHPAVVGILALAHPGLTVIMAHMGQGYFQEAIDAARQAGNLVLETSGESPFHVEMAVTALGAERVVYGTDTPFFPIPEGQRIVREAKISPADRDRIMGGNAARILGLRR